MVIASRTAARCGIVLAAGEGRRLRSFIGRLRGNALPKQYVNFIGTRSMLEHTFWRAERLIPADRLFTVVSQDHLGYPEVRRQLAARPGGTVIAQPQNKETGPGLLLPLMHLCKRYPNATVVTFPSDHFIVEEELFMAHVDLACRVIERYPSYMILLGMQPRETEPEYGYIVPGPRVSRLAPLAVRQVLQFKEKPEPQTARELVLGEGLWNTMVMIFNVRTLLGFVRNAAPQLYRAFLKIREAIGTIREMDVVEEAYRQIEPLNFSSGFLESFALEHAPTLLVLPVQGVVWSDWGSERRVIDALRRTGCLSRLNGIPGEKLHRIWGETPGAAKTLLLPHCSTT